MPFVKVGHNNGLRADTAGPRAYARPCTFSKRPPKGESRAMERPNRRLQPTAAGAIVRRRG
jgi:hypothetical protein